MTAEGNAANDELREAIDAALGVGGCGDIVLALPELAALRAKAAAADRARELHVSDGHGWCRYCGQITEGDLHEAGWPCRTIRALDGPATC